MEYNYRLHLFTPVHIGDGTSYTKKEYYLITENKDGKEITLINRVNLNQYIKSLSSEEQDKILIEIKKEDFKLPATKDFNLYFSEKVPQNSKKEKHPTIIESTIKDIEFQPYIPGSSIKGSIKTAILYDQLKKYRVSTQKDYEKICNNYNQLNFKISISDTSTANYIKTIQPLPITLEGEKEKAKNKDPKKSGMYNALECIPMNNNLDFNIKVENININYIKECLYYFNHDYIEHELGFYKKIGRNQEIINEYAILKDKNTKEEPLIRIGGSTGLLSTTIGLHMKNNNINLFTNLFKDKDGNPVDENFPKIRKITPDIKPFGWCRLKSLQR